jgi:hypothetical protein
MESTESSHLRIEAKESYSCHGSPATSVSLTFSCVVAMGCKVVEQLRATMALGQPRKPNVRGFGEYIHLKRGR